MFALSQQSCGISFDLVCIVHMTPDDAAREAGRNLLGFVSLPSIVLQLGLDLVGAWIVPADLIYHCRMPHAAVVGARRAMSINMG